MIYLTIFITLSTITSLFAVAACMLSSQSNQRYEQLLHSEIVESFPQVADRPAVALRTSESVS